VVDVALVYYLIYRLLLTIRGTRAAQMIVGIVLVGAAFFVAERLELSTVSWLLDNFISYFIILIIVVFSGYPAGARASARTSVPGGREGDHGRRSVAAVRSSRARHGRSSCSSAMRRSRSSWMTRRASTRRCRACCWSRCSCPHATTSSTTAPS
jgi:DNA integrity scanning protein DisA with diadenylate cyclase activity